MKPELLMLEGALFVMLLFSLLLRKIITVPIVREFPLMLSMLFSFIFAVYGLSENFIWFSRISFLFVIVIQGYYWVYVRVEE